MTVLQPSLDHDNTPAWPSGTTTRDGWEIRYGQPTLGDDSVIGVGDPDLDGREFDGHGFVEYRDKVWFFDGDEATDSGYTGFDYTDPSTERAADSHVDVDAQ